MSSTPTLTLTPNPTAIPIVHLTATLTTPTISLSHVSPTSPPISLNLQLRLQNATKPLTLALTCSALSTTPANYYRSYYHLIPLSTGSLQPPPPPRQMKAYCLLVGPLTIENPETELLTLYPDSLSLVELSVPIGISASASYAEKRDRHVEDTLGLLAIAATPLSGLTVGAKFRVELKEDLSGEFPGRIWWWEWGQKEEILRARRGRGGGEGPVRVEIVNKFSGKFLRVRMGEGPILEVVE